VTASISGSVAPAAIARPATSAIAVLSVLPVTISIFIPSAKRRTTIVTGPSLRALPAMKLWLGARPMLRDWRK
jgi:hypothetical protein